MSSITGEVNTPVMPASIGSSVANGAGLSLGKRLSAGIGYAKQHWLRIVGALLLLAVVATILYSAFHPEDCANITFIDAARHYGCKTKGGCSADCPHIHNDDPRYVMKHKVKTMEESLSLMTVLVAEDSNKVDAAKDQLRTESEKMVLESTLNAICTSKEACVANVSTYAAVARAELAAFGNADSINTDVVNAKNRVSGYEAIINLNVNAFACLTLQMESIVMATRIGDVDESLNASIKHYGLKSTDVAGSVNKITSIVSDVMKIVNGGRDTEFGLKVENVQSGKTSDVIIGGMSVLMNLAASMEMETQRVKSLFETIAEVFKSTFKSGFKNVLHTQLGAADVSTLIDDNDYNTALIKPALEPEIVTNQLKFAGERSAFNSGGGVHSVRDDDNDIVPWVGLFDRPTYRQSDGSSIEKSNEPLRSIPSDVPEDLMRTKTSRISFVQFENNGKNLSQI